MANIDNNNRLTIIEGILNDGDFNLCYEKAEINYQDNEIFLSVEINFNNCSESFEMEIKAVPQELTEEEKDLIYDVLKENHEEHRENADSFNKEYSDIQEDNLEMILNHQY